VAIRSSDGQFCTGSLLRISQIGWRSDIVLTSAQCANMGKESMTVFLGTNNNMRDKDAETTGVMTRQVADIRIHESYNPTNHVNDIAIIKLSEPVDWNDKIFGICLPSKTEQMPRDGERGLRCVTTGFGQHGIGKFPKELQQVVTQPHTAEFCRNQYAGKYNEPWDTFHFCAGDSTKRGMGVACKGDVGSPLVCNNEYWKWTQYGLMSFEDGGECTRGKKPGAYTNISMYVPWIYEKILGINSAAAEKDWIEEKLEDWGA